MRKSALLPFRPEWPLLIFEVVAFANAMCIRAHFPNVKGIRAERENK